MRFHKAVFVALFVAVSAQAEPGGIDPAALQAVLGGAGAAAHLGAEFGPAKQQQQQGQYKIEKPKPTLGELINNCLVTQGNPAASDDILRRAGIR